MELSLFVVVVLVVVVVVIAFGKSGEIVELYL